MRSSSPGPATTKWTKPPATDGPRCKRTEPSKDRFASIAAMKSTSSHDAGILFQQPARPRGPHMANDPSKPFAEWIGRRSESEDLVTPRLAASFRAVFAPHVAPVSEGIAPLGLHWCLAPPLAPMEELGPDGHPAKNHHLPPVPLPRRMWASGWIETFEALRIGDRVTRVSTIADIARKQGRT